MRSNLARTQQLYKSLCTKTYKLTYNYFRFECFHLKGYRFVCGEWTVALSQRYHSLEKCLENFSIKKFINLTHMTAADKIYIRK